MTPVFPQVDLPDLTTEQMREVDRRMIDEFAIQLVQMMENSGSHLALAGQRPVSSQRSSERVSRSRRNHRRLTS